MGESPLQAERSLDIDVDEYALTVEGMGSCVRLVPAGEHAQELTTMLLRAWSRCWVPNACVGPAPVRVCLTPEQTTDHVAPDESLLVEGNLPTLLERTTQRITAALISEQAGKLMLFHAGAVCDPLTGRSIAYVAPSRTGKTTLTLELGKRFGYLTDETVAVDEDLRIYAYPKPLSVRDPGGAPRQEISPDELGLLPAHPNPRLHRLVVLERDENHEGPPRVEELAFFDAVVQLAPQMSSLGALPHGLHRLRAMTDAIGPALVLRYRESESIIGLFETLLEIPLVVRRTDASDFLVGDEGSGEALILLDDHVVRLGELGAVITQEADRSIELDDLAARLEDRFGNPGDGVGLRLRTRGAVDELLKQGVLERVVQGA